MKSLKRPSESDMRGSEDCSQIRFLSLAPTCSQTANLVFWEAEGWDKVLGLTDSLCVTGTLQLPVEPGADLTSPLVGLRHTDRGGRRLIQGYYSCVFIFAFIYIHLKYICIYIFFKAYK